MNQIKLIYFNIVREYFLGTMYICLIIVLIFSAFNDSSNRNQHEKKIHGVTFNAKNSNIDDIKAE